MEITKDYSLHNNPYPQVNNEIYEADGAHWWSANSPLFMMYALNPARVGYYQRILDEAEGIDPSQMKALEVGSGGGILSEEIARMGFDTYGIDPSPKSVETAREHARAMGLSITYAVAEGEHLPFADEEFDVVFCCDVLEHVESPPHVLKEISRVLKPGGILFHETINRTWLARLIYIKLFQEWEKYAWLPEDFHLYSRFITPKELRNMLRRVGIINKDFKGIEPIDKDPPRILSTLKQRARNEIDFAEMAARFKMKEGKYLSSSYMGYGIKEG